jgi:hypothetical protein
VSFNYKNKPERPTPSNHTGRVEWPRMYNDKDTSVAFEVKCESFLTMPIDILRAKSHPSFQPIKGVLCALRLVVWCYWQ